MYLQIIGVSQIAYINAVQFRAVQLLGKNFLTATFIVPYYIFFNSKLQTEGKDSNTTRWMPDVPS